ncbi:MAG: radical SAM protein [Defluviitaleaceae bacterium]|nr:radical SAM protein [Defluviitaleaceae bacterium]
MITNIQRYSIYDGPGIRTTVFFKGCPLSCEWCHNPETQSYEGGQSYTPQELARIVLRDQMFFGETGGITISGGEPLAQDMEYMVEFLSFIKSKGIHITCDTCGDVPWENFEVVLPYVDLFLYDIKLATPELHKQYTGRDNQRIITNLNQLIGANCVRLAEVWLRIPVIGGVNDGDEMAKIMAIAPKCKVCLLPYHSMATGKWEKLNKMPTQFCTPSKEKMTQILADWQKAGFDTQIGG